MASIEQHLRTRRAQKEERLEARMPRPIKELIQRAADLRGLSLTDFITISAQQAAEATIREQRVIALTARDSLLFAEALLNPHEPNKNLRAAFALHDEDVRSVG